MEITNYESNTIYDIYTLGFNSFSHVSVSQDPELDYKLFKNNDSSFKTDLMSNSWGMCASVDSGVRCVGRFRGSELPSYVLEKTDLVVIDSSRGSAVKDGKIRCWEVQIAIL